MRNDFFEYFKHITLIQCIDIGLVFILIFQLFRALRRSVAFNIFIGSLFIYIAWIVVNKLNMPIMSEFLDRLVSIGLIGMIVVFQPELRKFLVLLGKQSPVGKDGIFSKLFRANTLNKYYVEEELINEISEAFSYLINNHLGAIIVIAKSNIVEFDTNTGKLINGNVSAKLLESIFCKTSPLHDGAVLIVKDQLVAAGIVLPLSDRQDLPNQFGLRHRSAIGATEHSNVLVVVLSEETQKLTLVQPNAIQHDVSLEEVKKVMYQTMIQD
ncbi:MAG: diadenylate cyclase [Chitinophagaceae bacterium]